MNINIYKIKTTENYFSIMTNVLAVKQHALKTHQTCVVGDKTGDKMFVIIFTLMKIC